MNKKYNLKLDLQFRCNNSTMKFNQFDNNTSDFFMRITNGGNLVDIEKAIVVLAIIKPSGKVASQFVEVENGLVYADLKPSMKDEIGTYTAQAMLILEDERVVTDAISYEVEEDKIFSLLNDSVRTSEEFTLLTDMLSRLSTIETNEEQRVINEAERILSEENRKIEEVKRVEAELIRQHEEADRAKYDAIRESNENIRKQNESIRLTNETNRIDEEAKRVEEEAKRVEAEQLRKDNYNFMTEDEERRRVEANAHKEAEKLRVSAENTRVNEEAKRRTTEQARVSAENTRVNNENTRESNEVVRKNNETKRVEAETQRQNRYNSFIADAEANTSNFENYTNTAKVKEEERKSNELDRKSQETKRVSNEVERISNENTRKANEVAREKNETSRQNIFENKVDEIDEKIVELNTTKDNFVSSINTKVDTKISELNTTKDNFVSSVNAKVDTKISELDNAKSDMTNTVSNKVNEVETRFNALTSSQQQDAEVIDARDGETSLKARLDRDIEKAKQVYVNVEGSNISTDSSDGYLKDVEILGNTIQDSENLADIRSVGDTVEGQELYEIPIVSCGKNLFDLSKLSGGEFTTLNGKNVYKYIDNASFYFYNGKFKKDTQYTITMTLFRDVGYEVKGLNLEIVYTDGTNKNFSLTHGVIRTITSEKGKTIEKLSGSYNHGLNAYIDLDSICLNEGDVAINYQPYIEDKLTILSPVQLEKVGDVADRIICKDGVWGVEKNVVDTIITGNESNTSLINCNDGVNKYFGFVKPGNIYNIKNGIQYYHITNKLNNGNAYNGEDNVFWLFFDGSNTQLRIRLDDSYTTKEQYIEWLKSNNILVKYITTQPQFIPLPHDQQVKLRTFANKTNISFLTEIEGTIKAQVPKSLGATVNTHTEQIRSLNNELNRVKKLEESTVSTVTTESDFTTVEATSNGYFEDVKLEGKTLVNLATQPTNNGSINNQYATISTVTNIKPSTEYTYIIRNNGSEMVKLYLNNNGGFDWRDLDVEANSTVIGKAKTLPTIEGDIWLSLSKAETIEQNLQVVLLEGDHTQNPPSYFEGLKSVGQDVNEISVESVNENLFTTSKIVVQDNLPFSCEPILDGIKVSSDNALGFGVNLKLKAGNTYYFSGKSSNIVNVRLYRKGGISWSDVIFEIAKEEVNCASFSKSYVCTQDAEVYFRFWKNAGASTITDVTVSKKPHTDTIQGKQDKKRLLYYNEETQTWEKPILREWDSIEKHANGKYYYHQRSGEVVLNGSESWSMNNTADTNNLYYCECGIYVSLIKSGSRLICNTLQVRQDTVTDKVAITTTNQGIMLTGTKFIRIKNSSCTSLNSFKQWLQANNVTVVYQLVEEKVYECTNIDLITYANETNYIVESGAIAPKTTLKVHNNISNVVSLLQKKVSLLESNVTSYMITQNRLMLASRYNADTVSFKVDVASFSDAFEYDNDLYELILNNVLVGKDNYNREYIENLIRFYWMDFVISDEMYSTLFEIIEEQHNPKIEEETPLI